MKTEVQNQFCNNSSDNFGLWLAGLEAKCGPSLLLTRVSRKLLVKWARGESCSRLVNWGDTTQGWFYFRLHPCFFVDFSINACCSWGYTIQDNSRGSWFTITQRLKLRWFIENHSLSWNWTFLISEWLDSPSTRRCRASLLHVSSFIFFVHFTSTTAKLHILKLSQKILVTSQHIEH